MNSIKLGNFEAIAIIVTITITHSILTLPKSIMVPVDSAALLNLIYVSILALFLSIIIYKLLNNFPGLDIIDISEFLGGKILQRIVGLLFLIYVLFVSSVLLRTFAHCLKIVYYPMTDLIFILAIFAVSIPISCTLSSETIFKANLIIIPVVLLGIVFLFIANTKYFNFENIYPLFGNGINATFIKGASNIFAFGGITVLYLLPPILKDKMQFKKVSILSTVLSSIYFILTIATILFMFSSVSFTNELMPLYSSVRYIEFGTFFQRLDSVFLLTWILAFFCYLGISFRFCTSIYKKITNIKSNKIISYPLTLLVLGLSLLPKDESITSFLEGTVYRYIFLIFSIGISLLILVLAYLKKKAKTIKE
ncbi:MAG: endospore germination permease [Clostridia bacterium]|nr:endospore germination permease [Clostridia bacterium]